MARRTKQRSVADEDVAVMEDAVDANEPDLDIDPDVSIGGLQQAIVTIRGLTDIQFNRFVKMDQTDIRPEEMLYLQEDGTMYLPNANLLAFFYSSQYQSCIKMFVPTKQSKIIGQEAKALISVSPNQIVFKRNGKPIKFTKFENERDRGADLYIHHDVARVKGAVAVVLARPTLHTPWELEFMLGVYEMASRGITIARVKRWLVEGGVLIGVGNHRPMFGKFEVVGFDVK